MRRFLSPALLLLVCFLTAANGPASLAQVKLQPSSLQTNATPSQLRAIEAGVDRLSLSVESRDAKTLQSFGLTEAARTWPMLSIRTRISAAAVAPAGALVRLDFLAWGGREATSTPKLIGEGTLDLWMTRSPVVGGEVFTPDTRRWSPPTDAADALAQAAMEEWANLEGTPATDTSGAILHLVAQERGGRWIALRRSRWDGAIMDQSHLAPFVRAMPGSVPNATAPRGATPDNSAAAQGIKTWLQRQMAKYNDKGTGIGHFILQRGPNGWVGLDSMWEDDRNTPPEWEDRAANQRMQMEGSGFLSAAGHRDFAAALTQLGLYAEAADEYEKAEALSPGLLGAARLRQAAALRGRDPQALAIWQVQNESKIGIGRDHPVYVLSTLAKQQGKQPTLLGSLQIGLEYSKLAQDERANSWLKYADGLIANNAMRNLDENDQTWAEILHDQLAERRQYAGYKPTNIVRSGLFTLRCWPNDLNTVAILAGLEAAQHVVYADFAAPMGNTEVVLWRNQGEFQAYTTRVSGETTSEFIAALTLTKLVQSQNGPVVLGEEVNVFADDRSSIISTLRHEYGHVAVRQITHGRTVPMWLNEGIATTVEGGYDGYIPRVRTAANTGNLLTMDELLEWNFDGERAFLAYSQANSLIDYIGARWGRDAIMQILRQIGRDVPPETAIRSVLKISSQDLWNRWSRDGIM